MRTDILEVVKTLTGYPVFYAADPANFWVAAENCDRFPAIGLYECQGSESMDSAGVLHPRIELHVITVGGSMDERTAPSPTVSDGRAALSDLLKRLRPWLTRIPQQCGFSRKSAFYTNWAEIELRDPLTVCVNISTLQ